MKSQLKSQFWEGFEFILRYLSNSRLTGFLLFPTAYAGIAISPDNIRLTLTVWLMIGIFLISFHLLIDLLLHRKAVKKAMGMGAFFFAFVRGCATEFR